MIAESVREPDAGLPTAFARGHSAQQIMKAPYTRAKVDEEASPTVEGKAAFEATNPKHRQQR